MTHTLYKRYEEPILPPISIQNQSGDDSDVLGGLLSPPPLSGIPVLASTSLEIIHRQNNKESSKIIFVKTASETVWKPTSLPAV